jgi:tRNA (guanine-N7-)-methyltransferase
VEVELGCADADFLFGRVSVAPDRCYVGVDIRAELVEFVNAKAAGLGLMNVRAVYANLLTDLPALFAEASIDTCHINFPDPFFKRSQHKRRFLTPELVESLGRVIRPFGTLAFQSDVFELGLEALEILERSYPRFRNALTPWSFARENPYGAMTRRERQCVEREQRIWRLRYTREP